MSRGILVVSAIMLMASSCTSTETRQGPAGPKQKRRTIKVVVVTGGHGFKGEPFFSLFDGYGDIAYVEAKQEDDSDIFDDVSKLDYDVIVLFNMTQEISVKRRENFMKLLEKGVGVVALHHSIGAFQGWPEYRRIIGGKYYLKATEEAGVMHEASKYKHDLDIRVHIEDPDHPITRGMSDFVVHDETYRNCVFEKDNQVLLSTDHPTSDKPLCWVRKWKNASVCYIQIGHGTSVYANENYRRLVARAIRWCGGKLN